MKRQTITIIAVSVLAAALAACNKAPELNQRGATPELPEPDRGLMPDMTIAKPTAWGDRRPTVPSGYRIAAIATDLGIPRQTLVLPNGDILVAEGRGGGAPNLKPKDVIAGAIKAKGNTSVKSGNRLTLLRDANGDGTYELKTVFAENLNAPYGLALIGNALYVANQDALVRFDYREGQTKASGAPAKVTDLPSAINHHWTKALTASADGRYLYVAIGSNSNITERGMAVEIDRAQVWKVDPATGAHKPYATGIRNPTALAIQPGSGTLWAVVNERDEIGPNLVPDYLTSVREGGFYGWPYSYWGKHVDTRVMPQDPQKVASAITPDYALGSHVAALGVAFSSAAMGTQFADGVFVGEHGSWNRDPPVGYKVVFVPFRDGRPAGDAIDFVSGFHGDDGLTRGRPVGVTVDPRGALIVADDLANTIWRVTPDAASNAVPNPAPEAAPAAAPASPN
ncbi:sorbosone dehydrogenase family protein [Xanthomonas hortorum pv. vitians]|uniref:PQQ-dependent sugar dehydrogenase n=2 Tax=Xanthomonas hortorum TaxID=56454 RepID=UPI0012A98E64|nr:sorbosone dehydrogenase family protein [Xanthomonas hortorum]MCE4286472.1 sorbosone dehydrogenase family protein [Xanthomonas hortorum pv. vitians]MCE4291062.1 sorbosone dehydrogenase family protein [Xanthomonas hortorum pv. vitians]MCE4295210.1 sorbosone dehydrogenase family protein [Xanthomonas hortorum pv. vitians]MDT7853853.1 sorbosone dehydrogenase family protein [Xanthomonas hortorum pv. vitians]NMI27935.1 sorbosone dehydrogenase family protein [Xanthomonas hortorum pv. vitians]